MTEVTTVCHIATLTRWGGVERMLVDFLTRADQKTIRHLLITTSSKPEIVQLIKDAGIDVFQPKRRFHYDPGAIFQMAKWLRSHRVDIVHSYNAFANAWGNMAALYARTPGYLTYERGTIWNVKPPVSWFDRWANHRAGLVVANSKASARLLQLKYKIPENKIKVIYNAVPDIENADPMQMRDELGIPGDALVVGSVGRLDTAKDYGTFIRAAALVLKKRDNVVFVLVGGGPLEKELQELVNKSGITDRFIMTGWKEEARRLIHGFDSFVSTSIREPFGNVLIEAALCEKPVIAPAIDGVPEAVIHGKTGLLLKPDMDVTVYRTENAASVPENVLMDGNITEPRSLDPIVLSAEILSLLDNYDLRKLYGSQARERALKEFSMERYIKELEDKYLMAGKL